MEQDEARNGARICRHDQGAQSIQRNAEPLDYSP
jgi:hypothetical protein